MFQHGISTQTHISKRHTTTTLSFKRKEYKNGFYFTIMRRWWEPLSLRAPRPYYYFYFWFARATFLSVKISIKSFDESAAQWPSHLFLLYWKKQIQRAVKKLLIKIKNGRPGLFYLSRKEGGGRPGGDAGHGRGAQDAAARLPRRTGWLLLLRLPTKKKDNDCHTQTPDEVHWKKKGEKAI